MRVWALSLILILTLAPVPISAQDQAAKPQPPLGLKLQPVPEALYHQLPQLTAGQGVLVDQVTPDSPAAQTGLQRFDIILSIGSTLVHDEKTLTTKLRALRPGEREVLEVLRGGKKLILSWPRATEYSEATKAYVPPKSFLKPNGPPAVSVQVHPQEGDKLGMTILYYNRDTGKLASHSFEGRVGAIEQQVHSYADQGRIPADVYDLIGVALKRIRTRGMSSQAQ